jgi:hypothetical protein
MIRISRKLSLIGIMINQKQPENVKYFKYVGSTIIIDARYTCEIKSRIAVAKEALTKQ